ncbi:hypothetical protein [Streptomyces sp. 8N706]|uniref:hypothetical protein n=1 Tax=Streptomyces sp. 8N706 TaxID=3457416 RepID=UPI003FD44AA6
MGFSAVGGCVGWGMAAAGADPLGAGSFGLALSTALITAFPLARGPEKPAPETPERPTVSLEKTVRDRDPETGAVNGAHVPRPRPELAPGPTVVQEGPTPERRPPTGRGHRTHRIRSARRVALRRRSNTAGKGRSGHGAV